MKKLLIICAFMYTSSSFADIKLVPDTTDSTISCTIKG